MDAKITALQSAAAGDDRVQACSDLKAYIADTMVPANEKITVEQGKAINAVLVDIEKSEGSADEKKAADEVKERMQDVGTPETLEEIFGKKKEEASGEDKKEGEGEKPEEGKPAEEEKPAEEKTEDEPAKTEDKPADEEPKKEEDKPAEDKPAEEEKKEEEKPSEGEKPVEEEKASEEDAAEAEKIKALEKELADLEAECKELEDKKAALTPISDEDKEASKAQLKEAQEQHQESIKRFNSAEQEKFEIQPLYEQCLANKEQKERANNLNSDIEAAEKKVKDDEAKVVELDDKMSKVSAEYSAAKDALETFTKELNTQLQELHKAVAEKIDKTISAPAEAEDDTEEVKQHRATVALNCVDLLDALEVIVREREREIHHASRQLREVKAILDMKAEEEEHLTKELHEASAQKKKENDEYIKSLVYSFQDVRSNLQADIEEIKKVNQEQAYNLRRGHVEKTPAERASFSTDTGRGKTAAAPVGGRQSSFRRDTKPTKEQQQMKERNEELQTELNTVKKKLAKAVTDRTEGMKTLKNLRARVARDKERFKEELNELDGRIHAETYAVETQELENKRLAEAVEHLTFVVQSTRTQVVHIRAHKDPLPIEDYEE